MITVEQEWQRQLEEYTRDGVETCPAIEACDHSRARNLVAKTIKLTVCGESYRDCQYYQRARGIVREDEVRER